MCMYEYMYMEREKEQDLDLAKWHSAQMIYIGSRESIFIDLGFSF